MNNLEKIQKTMKVFQTLTKIVMGLVLWRLLLH